MQTRHQLLLGIVQGHLLLIERVQPGLERIHEVQRSRHVHHRQAKQDVLQNVALARCGWRACRSGVSRALPVSESNI